MASFLITNDADINTAQLGKRSPLHIVRRASNPEIVFVLVQTYSIGGSNCLTSLSYTKKTVESET